MLFIRHHVYASQSAQEGLRDAHWSWGMMDTAAWAAVDGRWPRVSHIVRTQKSQAGVAMSEPLCSAKPQLIRPAASLRLWLQLQPQLWVFGLLWLPKRATAATSTLYPPQIPAPGSCQCMPETVHRAKSRSLRLFCKFNILAL